VVCYHANHSAYRLQAYRNGVYRAKDSYKHGNSIYLTKNIRPLLMDFDV
jgi:hypothetical protein